MEICTRGDFPHVVLMFYYNGITLKDMNQLQVTVKHYERYNCLFRASFDGDSFTFKISRYHNSIQQTICFGFPKNFSFDTTAFRTPTLFTFTFFFTATITRMRSLSLLPYPSQDWKFRLGMCDRLAFLCEHKIVVLGELSFGCCVLRNYVHQQVQH